MRFLLIFISFVRAGNHPCLTGWSLIWKALCPQTGTTTIYQVVFPGLIFRTEWWQVMVHDYCIESHIWLGWSLSEARGMSKNDICPLSLFFLLNKNYIFKLYNMMIWYIYMHTHTHSEIITTVKLINICSPYIVDIFLYVWLENLKSILLANFQHSKQ